MLDQAEDNYRWFRGCLANLLLSQRGDHVLLHKQSIGGYFGTSLEAIKVGMSRHGEGDFSVELVDDAVEDLGFYSHVGSALHA